MKTFGKILIGFLLGLFIALAILWSIFDDITTIIICAIAGTSCIGIGLRTMWRKVVSSILVCAMAAAPSAIASDTFAGYDGKNCYCITPLGAAESPTPTQYPNRYHAVVLHFTVETNGSPRVLSIRHPNPETLVSWDELNADFVSAGVDLDQHYAQYAVNGQPVSATDAPFRFGGDWIGYPFVLYPDRPQHRVIVETSAELGEFAYWQPVARLSLPANTPIQYQDTPDGPQAFYRVRLDTTPEGQFQAAGPIVLGCGLGLLAGLGVVSVLTVRACAKNKKKFQKLTNSPPSLQLIVR
jgi:hypothetical protein